MTCTATTKIAKLLLAGTMAVTTLLALGANAHAQSPAFRTGDRWNGFAQSSVSDRTRGGSVLLIDRAQASGFTGRLLVYGRTFGFQATYGADGSIAASGDGVNLHGAMVPAGNSNYAATFSYRLSALNDQGTVDLLRMYPPDPCKPVVFPPDPCKGSFVSSTGRVGGLILQHAPPSELDPPSDFVGTVTFGDQAYDAVGTIAQTANRDGSYSFEIIGQNSVPGAGAARVHISGSVIPGGVTPCVKPGCVTPCVKPGCVTPCIIPSGAFTGDYAMVNLTGKTLDEGIVQLAF